MSDRASDDRWRDFNDATPQVDDPPLAPDPAMISAFLDVVLSYCEGLVPLRGLAEAHGAADVRPHHIWADADGGLPDSALTFAQYAAREGLAAYVVPGTVANRGQASAEHVQQIQTVLIDLDAGDIDAKLDHLTRRLGLPTLVVESGGRTPAGRGKLHVYYRLTEPAEGDDIKVVCHLRAQLALKVGGDQSFSSAHQPIRIAGSVYLKGVRPRLVKIRQHNPRVEVDLREFAEAVEAMPALPGVDPTLRGPAQKPSLDNVLTTPVREGGQDDWTRFHGVSAAIGHYVRLAHDGRMSRGDAWEAVCQYNAATLRPPWPLERLEQEFQRLWRRHEERHGPPLEPRQPTLSGLPAYTLGALLDDTSPMPADIIAPRVLTPGGMLVLGGAPKIGKSDFLINLLVHMAAGVAFLSFTPSRRLRIFYLQAEIQYHYLRERLQGIHLEPALLDAARGCLVATPKVQMLLDEQGVALAIAAMHEHYAAAPPDIICVDPIRNLFDGGPGGGTENDNHAMMFFLLERVERLRDAINPDAGVILCHHTRKTTKDRLAEDPFMALSGAGSLRSFYTSGIIMHRPDEGRPERKLHFELRNGPGIEPKIIDKVDGQWVEVDASSERLVRKDLGAKQDRERDRRRDVILSILDEEAFAGRLYNMTQFAEGFENRHGLGGKDTIRERLDVHATKGYVKFVRACAPLGLGPTTSKFGFLCIEGMEIVTGEERVDPETGEIEPARSVLLPTHYKCPQTGAVLEVEDPSVWVYPDGEEP